MKRVLLPVIVGIGLFMIAFPAWSATIDAGAIDVGSLDPLIGSIKLANSGDATELAWAQSIIGGSVTLTAKYDTTGGQWDLTNISGVYAHTLDFTPEYFLVKTGNVANPDYRDFLFRNNDNLSFAVIDLGAMGFKSISNVSGISHLDEFNGKTAPVPEPGTMMLLGSGLVGLAGYGRRRFKK